MANLLRQSTAVTIKAGPFLDDGDGKTAETGLTIPQADVRLSKNGGAYAQKNESSASAHDEGGEYDVALDVTDTGTLGRLKYRIHKAGALPVWDEYTVITQQAWDSLCGADKLQVHAVEITNDLITPAAIATDAINEIRDAILADSTPFNGASIAAILADTGELQTDDVPGLIAALNDFDPASDKVYLADGAHGGSAAVLTLEHFTIAATGNNTAFSASGAGTGRGIMFSANGTGAGMQVQGGTGQPALYIAATSGAPGLKIEGVGDYDVVLGNAGDGEIDAKLLGSIGSLAAQAKVDVGDECSTVLSGYDPPTKAEMDAGLAGLNDLSAAAVNAECDTALADYDPPTKAELDAGLAGLNDLSAAAVNAEVDTAIETYHLDHLIAVADPGGVVANNSLVAKLAASDTPATWASYVNTTDALQAIRDRGDAAWGAAGSETTLHEGTAQAGGASTITLAADAVATDQYYKYAILAITGGTGAGQTGIIESYVGTTRVATMSVGWAVQPDNTSEYKIFPFGSVPGASAPTAGEVADAVLDEAMADHQAAGSLGEELHLAKAVLANKRVMDTVSRAIEYMDDDGVTGLLTLMPSKTGPHELTVTPS